MFTEHVQILENLRGQVPDELIGILRTLLGNCSQDLVNRGQVAAIIDGSNSDKITLNEAPIVAFWTDDDIYAALKGYNSPSYVMPDIDDGVVNGFAADFKGVVRIRAGGGGNVAINQCANIGLFVLNQMGGAGGIWANIGDQNNYVENAYIDNLYVTNINNTTPPAGNTGFGTGTATMDSSGPGPYTINDFYYSSGTSAALPGGFTNPRNHVWQLGDAIYLGYNGRTTNWEVIDVPLRTTELQTGNDSSGTSLRYQHATFTLERADTTVDNTTWETTDACP